MGCLGTVICALISTIFIVYITEINPDMMFLLAALPFITLTILAAYGAANTPTRYADQSAVRKKMKSNSMKVEPEPQEEEIPEWKLEAERTKKQMLLESYEERAEIIRRREEKERLEQQRIAREVESAQKEQKNIGE